MSQAAATQVYRTGIGSPKVLRMLDGVLESRQAVLLSCVCAAIVILKLTLIWRVNINWDEFVFLHQVYEYQRGGPLAVLQTAYVHLFGWLTAIGGDEIDRILVGRVVMLLLLLVSTVLIARLARRFASASSAWIAPIAFLSASPVLRHGASFRADSILLPLTLLALVLLTARRLDTGRIIGAGLVFGLTIAISIKSVLLAPFLVLLIATQDRMRDSQWRERATVFTTQSAMLGAASLAGAAAVLGLHALSLPSSAGGSVAGVAVGSAQKTLIDVPFFLRWDYFRPSLEADWVTWSFIACGFAAALVRRRRAALFALSLSPLLFYRNAFPYYYLIMLAPASILVAVGVDALRARAGDAVFRGRGTWIPAIVCLPLVLQVGVNSIYLWPDRVDRQRWTVSAVHQIFPEPVPYVDHSGMIASFPKANFFMSTWGVDNYRARGVGFMRSAIADHRAPMVLANHYTLLPQPPEFDRLLEEDRQLIERHYVRYWGAIMVAGADVELEAESDRRVTLPFPGRYRVEADAMIYIDDDPVAPDDLITVAGEAPFPEVVVANPGADPVDVRLVWADAAPAPPNPPPLALLLYSPL